MGMSSGLRRARPPELAAAIGICGETDRIDVLFDEGAALPAIRSLQTDVGGDFGQERVLMFQVIGGDAPVAEVRVASSRNERARVELTISVDAAGRFAARVRDAEHPLRVLCITRDIAPIRPLSTMYERPKSTRSEHYIGLVEHARFNSLIGPGLRLPAVAESELMLDVEGGKRLFFDLLAIDPADLTEEEVRALETHGSFALSSGDEEDLLEFEIEGAESCASVALQVVIDAQHRLAVAGSNAATGDPLIAVLRGNPERLSLEVFRSQASESQGDDQVGPISPLKPIRAIGLRRSDGNKYQDLGVAPGPVFVSHRVESDGAFANMLVRRLENEGVKCWIAPRDIASGENWNRAIMKAIRACSQMVVIVSHGAIDSEFVQAEVQNAIALQKRVAPLVIDQTVVVADLDARLEVRQRIDWLADEDASVVALKRAIGQMH